MTVRGRPHDFGCICADCVFWFSLGITGLCKHCGQPIDRHGLDPIGRIEWCPPRNTVPPSAATPP
jgi:hypothetical protein